MKSSATCARSIKTKNQIDEYIFDANESMVANVRFANGALGTLHSSRWAVGHGNTVSLSVYGDNGAIDQTILAFTFEGAQSGYA